MISFHCLLLLAINNELSVWAGPNSQLSRLSQIDTSIPTLKSFLDLKQRQVTSYVSTCGYKNGDPNQPRTADSDYNCRVDTQNALWGFCPNTVISATDCGLAGNCVDAHACTSGCGIRNNRKITTFTWCVNCFLLALPLPRIYCYHLMVRSAIEVTS